MSENNYIANSPVEGDLFIISIIPLKEIRYRKALGFLLNLATIFIFKLICRWFVNVRRLFFYFEESELSYATHLLITNSHNQVEIHKIHKSDFIEFGTLYFKYRHLSYFYKNRKFSPLDYDENLKEKDISQLQKIYGPCQLIVPTPTILGFLEEELTSPLYFIQYVSVVLWLCEGFIQLAILTPILAILTSMINYIILRNTIAQLQKKATYFIDIKVKRNNRDIMIDSRELVPGDIIYLESNTILPCDCIILKGKALFDEQTLTGESIPVQKYAEEKKDPESKHNLAYDGTKILFTNSCVEAKVIRTGYLSYKGQIFRNALYPKPPKFAFFYDAIKFLLILSIAVIGLYFGLLWKMIELDYSAQIIALRFGDAIVWIVPPSMVIIVNLSFTSALYRLNKVGVMGTQPHKCMESSSVETLCFDKTGTLTENQVAVQSVQVYDGNQLISINEHTLVLSLMGTCHQAYLIRNELIGDSLDIAMINYSGFQIQMDPDALFIAVKNDLIYRAIRIFEFDAKKQRMGSIVNLQNQHLLFIKGAPEVIGQLCTNTPQSLKASVDAYALKGFRVIAMAYRQLQFREINEPLQNIEKNLEFLGLILFENKLKQDTAEVISTLVDSRYKLKMISGDHLLSSIQCGFESGILNANMPIVLIDRIEGQQIRLKEMLDSQLREFSLENDSVKEILEMVYPTSNYSKIADYQHLFAMTGPAFEYLQKQENFNMLCDRTIIFARMHPIQKSQIIQILQSLGKNVAMIGDGANDCHAIKQANIGISFQSTDASSTAAFTSNNQSLNCVINIVIQGKGTAANILEAFKYYMIINTTKYISAQLMMSQMQNFNNEELLYLNYLSNIPILALITISSPTDKLTYHRINTSMISFGNMLPLFVILIIGGANMLTNYLHLYFQPWYIPYQNNPDENTYIFKGELNTQQFLGINMYLLLSFFAINTYGPFKQRFFQQYHLYGPIGVLIILAIIIQFSPIHSIDSSMDLYESIISRSSFQFQSLLINVTFSIIVVLIGRITWIKQMNYIF